MKVALQQIPDPKNDWRSWGIKKFFLVGFRATYHDGSVFHLEKIRLKAPLVIIRIGGPHATLCHPQPEEASSHGV
jgi:hypothetical protein